MKTTKQLMLWALLGCLMLFSTAFTKKIPVAPAKQNAGIISPLKTQKTLKRYFGPTDSVNITLWYDTGVSTNWTITITGGTNAGGSYDAVFTTDANSANAPIGKIPPGSYQFRIDSNDGTTAEIDASCNYYYANLFEQHGSVGGSFNLVDNPNQELHFDFRNWPN